MCHTTLVLYYQTVTSIDQTLTLSWSVLSISSLHIRCLRHPFISTLVVFGLTAVSGLVSGSANDNNDNAQKRQL